MQTLKFDEFLRSLKQNIDIPHSMLLGAGASVESGIPSAFDCIWDWKREIYITTIDGFPVRRGLCYPINERVMHLLTHGIAPSVRNPNYKYIQGGTSIPLPLRIVKHYGNGSMEQVSSEILGLSKMNWNSFGLYSKLPCTIESSNEIARIGWLLSHYEGSVFDYRYFM